MFSKRACCFRIYLSWALSVAVLCPGYAIASEMKARERELQAAVEKVWPAVVMLRWEKPGVSATSGVVFDESGLVLTHGHHGQESREKLEVVFPDGTTASARLETVFDTYVSDWSVIKITDPGVWPAAKLCDGPSPDEQDRCFHIGYGGDLDIMMNPDDADRSVAIEPTLRIGQVLAVGERGIYADCETVAGDSGGPLFNLRGEILGIANQPKYWCVPQKTLEPDLAFGVVEVEQEKRDLGFTGKDRRQLDPHRGLDAEAFERLTDQARQATVDVFVGDLQVGCGLAVRPSGAIVTKRSLVLLANGRPRGSISCRLGDGNLVDAEVLGDSYEDDLALLYVEADRITAATLDDSSSPELGGFVVAVAGSDGTLVPGVVSVTRAYNLPPERGDLGAFLVAPHQDGVQIKLPEWLAKEGEKRNEANPLAWYTYGELEAGDVITYVNGVRIRTVDDYIKSISRASSVAPVAGDLFELTLKDGDGTRTTLFPAQPTYRRALENWGPPSHRRTGFREVFSHDALVTRDRCGGPLINSRGNIIGINIARYHQHQTLAIPSQRIREFVDASLSEINEHD